MFVPSLPADKVKVIEHLKMGTMNKIFLQFAEPFWDLKEPGFMFLHSKDDTTEDFFRHVVLDRALRFFVEVRNVE
jgi:hypothetical protein